MDRRGFLLLLAAAPLTARASSPDEAKRQDDKKKQEPKPTNPGKPKKGDREAPLSPSDINTTPGGRWYKPPKTR